MTAMMGSGDYEIGVDGLMCSAVTTIKNLLTIESSWKCSKVTSVEPIKKAPLSFKESGSSLPT